MAHIFICDKVNEYPWMVEMGDPQGSKSKTQSLSTQSKHKHKPKS